MMAGISGRSSMTKRPCARPWPRRHRAVARALLDFRSRGKSVEIVGYDNIRFTKAPHVLRGLGLSDLVKSEKAPRNSRTREWRRAEGQWLTSLGRISSPPETLA
jgi:hypothetical protein